MSSPRFKECNDRATLLLSKQKLTCLGISIRGFNYDRTILFDSVQNYAKITGSSVDQIRTTLLRDGCVIMRKGYYVVLYEESAYGHWERFNWTLAHEVGHIYMNHTKHGSTEEVEAHFFASQLFMPEYAIRRMLYKYKRVDYNDLSQIFWVSPEAAKKRILTLRKHRSHEWIDEDYQIYNQLQERIDIYFYCKRKRKNFRMTYSDLEVERAERDLDRRDGLI